MQQLKKGRFFGETSSMLELNGLTLTDTVYTHDRVDWHYHENAYFTFILQGNVIEANKSSVYNCTPGSLLFHNWDEAHYNVKPPGFTRGFHIEIDKQWFADWDISGCVPTGSLALSDSGSRLLMYKIFKESKMGSATDIAIQSLMLQLFSGTAKNSSEMSVSKPGWVTTIGELLRNSPEENLSLHYLSKAIDIHPVHLSRAFPKYFQCTLGEYIRKVKVEKALNMVGQKNRTLTEIAYECGFSDQSHFIRCCKEITGSNPSVFRHILS